MNDGSGVGVGRTNDGLADGPNEAATAAEGLALAAEFKLQEPTPVDTSTAA